MADLRRLRVDQEELISGLPVVTSSRVVSRTATHYDLGLQREQSPFVAAREGAGDVTFALVELENDFGDALESVDHVLESVHAEQEEHPDFEILEGGTASPDQARGGDH